MNRFLPLLEMLERNDLAGLRATLVKMNEVDIADFLEELKRDKAILVFRLLPKDLSADVFAYMNSDRQQMIVESISDKEIRAVIEELFLDDVVDFLEEVPANVVKRVLRNVDKDTHDQIIEFLKYPKNSAASLMTVEFVMLHDDLLVKDALEQVRKGGLDKESVDVLYAIDRTHHLTGYITLYKLLTADETKRLSQVMQANVLSVQTHDDQEQVAQTFSHYDLSAMPVVDHENRLVGIITVDDVVDVIQEENTEDIEIMAAITPSEKPYLQTGVFELAKNRAPWLLLLMVSATVTGRIIGYYNELLQSAVLLTTFIPMLMDSGGNAGSQASVMVIRNLALGEVQTKDFLKVWWKEFRIAILVGLALAVVNFFRIIIFEAGAGVMVALTVSLSLFSTVVVAKSIGCLLPILAKRIGFDPAVMASPLITTIVDAVSLMVFFGLATQILHIG